MNNIKVLSAAILLILAKSALGIEVEPNNDSSQANKLGKENVGKLNRASDVDFFSIDSCEKDDKKQCGKYTAADEKLNPLNKAGTVKYREEVSLSFTCNNRSSASPSGWFLGVHDSKGELQETYSVKPNDCIISDTTTGAFNFKFPIFDSPNYYVSVVADCAAPIYNTITDPKDPTKTIVNINKFVTAALTTEKDIKSATDEIGLAQTAIDTAKKDLDSADKGTYLIKKAMPETTTPATDDIFLTFVFIGSNANIQKLIDSLALATDIADIASDKLTAATNISAAISTAKAIEIAGSALNHSIYTYGQFLFTDKALKKIKPKIVEQDLLVKQATDALATEQKKLDAETTRVNDDNKKNGTSNTVADSFNAAVKTAQDKKDAADLNKLTIVGQVQADFDTAKAEDADATTVLTNALKAVDDAVKSLNDTVNANILAANTANNLGKRFDSACKDNYNAGIYTIKDNPDNEIKRLEDITSKAQKNLGLEQSGQISSIDDLDVYVVDNDGTTDVPLLFTCSALAARQTNDWKLSIYNDANGLVSSTLINGSSCGSVFIGDKGGYSFKLPKGSQRYYLAVESACASSTKKDCVVDTAEYSILRDVDKVYSGKLASKKIDAKSADLKLTNCGLNNGAVISIKAENVDLAVASKLAKLPINVQIGSTACRVLTPELSKKDAIIGSVVDSSEIIDSSSTAKDSANITLGECGGDKAKITLTGSKLDLVNFNPDTAPDSIVIPIKVNIGDFHCETKEVFYISPDATGTGAVYSNLSAEDATQPPIDPPVVVVIDPDAFDTSWLTTKKNLGASQTAQLSSLADVQVYQVDTGTTDANLTFSCPNSMRYQNDWKMLIYDNAKTLKSTTMINGSDCGTGKSGDKGAYPITLTKNSPAYYVVIKSACSSDDTTCAIDSSKYEIKRAAATSVITTPVKVKPFFTSTTAK